VRQVSQQLSWSHVVELLKIEDPLERNFYEQQTLLERWSVLLALNSTMCLVETNNFDRALRSLKTDIKFSKKVCLPKN